MGTRAQHPAQRPCWVTHTNARDARDHPRRPRPLAAVHRRHRGRGAALLPVDRGQGRALRRSRRAPDLPRARGPRHQRDLSERHLDVAAVRRAGRAGALDAGLRARAHPAARLRDRVRLLRSARAQADAGDEGDRRAVLRRPDQRHDRLRGGRRAGAAGGHQRRAARRRRRGLEPAPRRGLPRRAGRRPRHARRQRAVPDVHRRAPSTGCSCARTTPTCASPSTGGASASSTTRAGTRSASSGTRSRASSSG